MQLSISLILASGVFFAVDAIAAHKHVEDGEEDGLREEPDEVHHAAKASNVATHTDATPPVKATFHEKEAVADLVREEAQEMAEEAAEKVEQLGELVGELFGEPTMAKKVENAVHDETKMEAAADVSDAPAQGAGPAVEHMFIHRYAIGTPEAQCKGAFLSWTTMHTDPVTGVCLVSKLGLMIALTLFGLIDFGIWWVICKGRPRSQRALPEGSMAMTPYSPLDICSCWSLKTVALAESCCCNIFMWGETMVRSGAMPLPLVVFAGVVAAVISPVMAGLNGIYCCFRLVGRVQLRRKLAPNAPDELCTDCLAVTFCCPCAIAQETEYLELKANGGKPGEVPDADMQQLLQQDSKPEQM